VASTTPDLRADAARRLPPAAVLAAAGISLLEAVAVVAAALTGLDGLFESPARPSGAVAALWLLVLAAWAVLGAGGGLVLADGSGSRLLSVVACTELAALAVAFVLGLTTTTLAPSASGLPVPALALSAVAVPVGKLLLATAPSATAWSDAGPRRRVVLPQLGRGQRAVRGVTVAVIGLALASVALLHPVGDDPQDPWPATTGQH
jgi:hypothetical protein